MSPLSHVTFLDACFYVYLSFFVKCKILKIENNGPYQARGICLQDLFSALLSDVNMKPDIILHQNWGVETKSHRSKSSS